MPLVLPEAAIALASSQKRLLISSHIQTPDDLTEYIRSRGFAVEPALVTLPISAHLRALLSRVDIVLLDITTSSSDVLNALQELNSVIGICSPRPRLLCFSKVHRNAQFILQIERLGARYARITIPDNLLESIELLLAEVNALEHTGPYFEIVHGFARRGGLCSPGEEISAVLMAARGRFFQLPLGLAQRFVFDFLAQRRLAVDSLQIVSGLSGIWFFRDHASNSGHRQPKKIRRATVKVLVQRIREAMACTFEEAHVCVDPCDVLRSCYAEGSRRTLYKLHANIRWRHIQQ